jgi:N-acetylmuramoyl-L-alanine amidase
VQSKLISFIFFLACLTVEAKTRSFLVILDPGHGGSDLGTTFVENGKTYTEKELTLKIAQSIASKLKSEKIQVALTRESDVEIALPDRTSMANRLGAQLFISIHLNSKPVQDKKETKGFETYILNSSNNRSSQRLADLENKVLKGSAFQGATNPEVGLILKDVALQGNLPGSKRLACLLQDELLNTLESRTQISLNNRGVRQGLFYILLGADMPSVLVEAGFLANKDDRERVSSPAGLLRISDAFYKAILHFRSPLKNHHTLNKCKFI